MISKHIQENLVTYALIGAIGYLFTSASTGSHERDIMKKDIETNVKRLDKKDVNDQNQWNFIDERLRLDVEREKEKRHEEKENYLFALDMINKQHQLELELERLKK